MTWKLDPNLEWLVRMFASTIQEFLLPVYGSLARCDWLAMSTWFYPGCRNILCWHFSDVRQGHASEFAKFGRSFDIIEREIEQEIIRYMIL